MRTSHFVRFSYRLATIVLVLVGLGWHTNPAQAQPVCQVRTLASSVLSNNAAQISGSYVLWADDFNRTVLYSIDTDETLIFNEEGKPTYSQLSGNYVILPFSQEYSFTPDRVQLYDIAAKSETTILEDFGDISQSMRCSDMTTCGNIYYEAEYRLVDPIILVFGIYEDRYTRPMDIFVYDIATQTLDPLPMSFTGFPGWATILTDGHTIVWLEQESLDESQSNYRDIWFYDVASKITTQLTTDVEVLQVALDGSRIVWMYTVDSGVAVDLYNIADESLQTLPVSPIGSDYLTLTNEYVLWGDVPNTMQVYDLNRDTVFNVETADPEKYTAMFTLPRAFEHTLVWDITEYNENELIEPAIEVTYYDLANRTQTKLHGAAPRDSSPSISSGGVVWSGEYRTWQSPGLMSDVNLAVCETNLTVNGTFEANDDGKVKLPDGWRGVGALKGDRVVSDTLEDTFAYSPPHAFQFKGFPGERSRIISKADLRGHEMIKGDVLTLSAMVDQRSGVPGAQIVKATVRYTNGKEQVYRLRLPDVKTVGYIPLSVSKPLKFANVKKINLEVFYQKAKGKFIIDDVKLVLAKADATPALIPVPDAP